MGNYNSHSFCTVWSFLFQDHQSSVNSKYYFCSFCISFSLFLILIIQSGQDLIWHLYKSIQCPGNGKNNYIGLFTTLGLLSVELGSEDMLVDLFKLSLAYQVSSLYVIDVLFFICCNLFHQSTLRLIVAELTLSSKGYRKGLMQEVQKGTNCHPCDNCHQILVHCFLASCFSHNKLHGN